MIDANVLNDATTPVKGVAAGKTARVRATEKGYCDGPREPGDVFDFPLTKAGTLPKSSWFAPVNQKAAPQKEQAESDNDLA